MLEEAAVVSAGNVEGAAMARGIGGGGGLLGEIGLR